MDLIELFIASPAYFYPVVFVVSLCIGSFLNVVILRLPKMMQAKWRCDCEEFLEVAPEKRQPTSDLSLSHPNSTCPNCKHEIRAWENVPVVSYLALGGQCGQCKTRISPRYPVIEAITALLSLGTVFILGPSVGALLALILVWSLVALTFIDFDTQLLPDDITLPLLWLGLVINYFEVLVPFSSAFWGAIFGYLALWLVYHAFRLITGKEGMGYGDFKLLAVLGAWLGWEMLPAVILLSSLVGAGVGISLILFRGQGREVPIPFGPYLAAAGIIALWFGPEIQAAWFSYLGVA